MNRFTNLTAFATIGTALALAAIDPLPASAAGANEPPPLDDDGPLAKAVKDQAEPAAPASEPAAANVESPAPQAK